MALNLPLHLSVALFSSSVVQGALRMCVCAQWCSTLCDPVDCSPPGSAVHGICQARILEQVAISHSRGSSQPKDRTCVSCVSCIGLLCVSNLSLLSLKKSSDTESRKDPPWIQDDFYLDVLNYICRVPISESGPVHRYWRSVLGHSVLRTLFTFPGGSGGKESACNVEDLGWIPGSGRSPGERNGYSLQYFCLGEVHG